VDFTLHFKTGFNSIGETLAGIMGDAWRVPKKGYGEEYG